MKVLFVIAHRVFRDEEYAKPREVLEKRGVEIEVASTDLTMAEGKLGMRVKPDLLLSEVDTTNYSAVVFVGGGGAEIYFDDPVAHKIVTEMAEAQKVVCAICIGPAVLAKSGILFGKRVTAFPSVEEIIGQSGASYTGNETEVDGNIITANGPQSATRFGELIAEALGAR